MFRKQRLFLPVILIISDRLLPTGLNTVVLPDLLALGCVTVTLQGRLVLAVDNTAAIDIAMDVGVSGRTKHFDRAIHYLRDLTQLRRILPAYVRTDQRRADGYTKPLTKHAYAKWIPNVLR